MKKENEEEKEKNEKDFTENKEKETDKNEKDLTVNKEKEDEKEKNVTSEKENEKNKNLNVSPERKRTVKVTYKLQKSGKIKENNDSDHKKQNPVKQSPPKQLLKDETILINSFKSHYALSKPGKDEIGNTKTNQDTYIVLTSINGIKDFNIFGVLDGHGPEGHLVSQFISKYIQVEFQTHHLIEKIRDSEQIYTKLSEKDFKIIKEIFINADQALRDEDIDSKNSGTTCVLVIHIGEHIICANVGDSRAVLVFDEKNDSHLNYLRVFPLSIDNKPENPGEKERILRMGGAVEKIINKIGKGVGPYRVWVKNRDYPGLAMSRSIGDFIGKNVGVIPDPEIIECDLSIFTKYIVLCSDGVWEFLNNEDVMEFGKKFYLNNNPRGFCKELIENSIKYWKKEDIVVDDITVVTIFF